MQYKINNQVLNDFLKGVVREEFFIEPTELGWRVACNNQETTVFQDSLLKKEAFSQYVLGEKFSVRSKKKLLDFVGRFKGDVVLEVTPNSVNLQNENKEAQVQQGYKDLVSVGTAPHLEYESGFTIKSEVFHEAIKNAKLLENNTFQISVQGGQFTILVKSTDDLIKEKRPVQYKDVSVNLGDPMIEVFENVEGDVQVFMKSAYPVTIKQNTLFSNSTYIMAPKE